MTLLRSISRLLTDPPPAFAFELSQEGIAAAQVGRPPRITFRALEPDVLSISPLRDNVVRPEALHAQIRAAAPHNGGRKRRPAALILPDFCTRVSVLDFDSFPSHPKEQLSLVRFRLKRAVPFDVDAAAVSYFAQPAPGGGKKVEVVTALTPLEILARYEAPFRSEGFHTGLVTTSTLAALQLMPAGGLRILAKTSGRVFTLAVQDGSTLRLLRTIELAEATAEEMISHVFPTLAYTEDQLGKRPDSLVLGGFGPRAGEFREIFQGELEVAATLLESRFGEPTGTNAGLLGYLQSLEES